jgi:hypothetical protein
MRATVGDVAPIIPGLGPRLPDVPQANTGLTETA